VHAAAGGVGRFAVQVGVARGAVVIGTASPRNHDALRELGCAEVVDYTAGPVSEQLASPADAVVDLIGGEALEDAPKQVGDAARIVSVIDPETVLGIGGRYVFVRPERDHLDALAALADDGRLRVDVAETFPLERIAEAHRSSESGHTAGKIIVTV
jgi:NADPH:quinone reductase-like Zn-dependent oxidoreductase